MSDLFQEFLNEKTYLVGVSLKTIRNYKEAEKAFSRYNGSYTQTGVKAFVINMSKAGVKPGAINAYARSLNSYLSWLHKEKNQELLRVPLVKVEKRVLRTFKIEDVKKILNYQPVHFGDKRLYALLCTMIDTGVRIEETFTLKREGVDFENLLLTVYGKGRKERKIPMSRELRKILFRWLKNHEHDIVFCSRNGDKLLYDNTRRDFLRFLDKVGIKKSEGTFHAFRRYFAKHYVKNGGNLFYLMKQMGHTTLTMSKQYVEADEDDLKAAHVKSSPLERLKS